MFWQEAITPGLSSSDSASFFEIIHQGMSTSFDYCRKCITKKKRHLDILNADKVDGTGWGGGVRQSSKGGVMGRRILTPPDLAQTKT